MTATLGAVIEVSIEQDKNDYGYDLTIYRVVVTNQDGESIYLLWFSRHGWTEWFHEREAFPVATVTAIYIDDAA